MGTLFCEPALDAMREPVSAGGDRRPVIWKTGASSPDAEAIAGAGSLLKAGGIVVYPTETLYGLGADPWQRSAVERIYRVKGRGRGKPLPLIASSLEHVMKVAQWPKAASVLAKRFWPGPLTLLLPAVRDVPQWLHGGSEKIAVRVSSHGVAVALAEAIGGLLISTSANLSGQPAVSDVERIPPTLLALVDGILDSGVTGNLWGKRPTTIVDVCTPLPSLVRPGCVPWEAVSGCLD